MKVDRFQLASFVASVLLVLLNFIEKNVGRGYEYHVLDKVPELNGKLPVFTDIMIGSQVPLVLGLMLFGGLVGSFLNKEFGARLAEINSLVFVFTLLYCVFYIFSLGLPFLGPVLHSSLR